MSLVGLLFWAHPWVAYVAVAASMVHYELLSGLFLANKAVVSVLFE